jgi:hypothetical protein
VKDKREKFFHPKQNKKCQKHKKREDKMIKLVNVFKESNSISKSDRELLDFMGEKLRQGDFEFFEKNSIDVKNTPKYYVLNYNQIGAYISGINEYNRLTRGTIFDKNGKLVSLPFKRFFNQGEEHADVLNYNKAKVIEKLDGSLVSVFFDSNGNPVFNTRKMISSNEDDMKIMAKSFTDAGEYNLMEEFLSWVKQVNYKAFRTNDIVYIFEAITTKNKIVTKYKDDQYGLYLIGCRDMKTLEEFSEDELNDIAKKLGVKRPRIFSFKGNYKELKALLDLGEKFADDFEGFVVREGNKRVKVKKDTYLKLHKAIGSVSLKNLLPIVLDGEVDELKAYEDSAEAKAIIQTIEDAIDTLILNIIKNWDKVKHMKDIVGSGKDSLKKQFAQEVNDVIPKKYSGFMFSLYDGKLSANNLEIQIREKLNKMSVESAIKLLELK